MSLPEGWEEIDGRLMHEVAFENFQEAKSFVDEISAICEEQAHHADIHFGWGYVVIELMTHDEQAITEKDLRLAEAINALR
ncbi:MAG: 4a-hydroxytetrahydrobiopterin dehydratase [Candidatus Poseidonia sp.]|uniref:4a-hydroxytetrahydrobiopterin dehydratase n=1 Tax=Poseidonia sp. TaxID=2666344 RepID=UPI0030C06127|nr:4a-hydroxytetrahydrobiopterin dehydratase [Poseidonia sp.]